MRLSTNVGNDGSAAKSLRCEVEGGFGKIGAVHDFQGSRRVIRGESWFKDSLYFLEGGLWECVAAGSHLEGK